MKNDVEKRRILTETTITELLLVSIEKFTKGTLEDQDKLKE